MAQKESQSRKKVEDTCEVLDWKIEFLLFWFRKLITSLGTPESSRKGRGLASKGNESIYETSSRYSGLYFAYFRLFPELRLFRFNSLLQAYSYHPLPALQQQRVKLSVELTKFSEKADNEWGRLNFGCFGRT